jgi:hypothetical protein
VLKINNKVLKYAQEKKLCFVVNIENIPINCDCCNTNIKTPKTKILLETEVEDKEYYDVYEYQGVKVFILKDLKIVGDMTVYQKMKLPFMEPGFGIKGIIA